MAWDIPTPQAIADQASTDLEQGLAEVATARGLADVRIDARSNRSVLRVLAVVLGLALYPVYMFFAWVLDQLFVDRCDETWLPAHARMWGVERRAAIRAVGAVAFEGGVGTAIAADTRLSLSGAVWRTTAAAAIGAGGTVTVAVEAVEAGAAGNQAAGSILALETAIVGLDGQVATVAAGGITGGADIQSIAEWRAAVLARIRLRGHGGADFDYADWATEILAPARVTVHRNWVGAGTVGVVFAMGGYDATGALTALRAPTEAEVATMQAGLEARAPVTATVYALAGEPLAIAVEVEVSPWSSQVEAAVRRALAQWFVSPDAAIAGRLHRSRLQERLSRAAGEDWHRLVTPAADVTLGPRRFPVPGTITIGEAT